MGIDDEIINEKHDFNQKLQKYQSCHLCRWVTRGGEGGWRSPLPFSKIQRKGALILGKNALTRFFYRLNFSFKMQF